MYSISAVRNLACLCPLHAKSSASVAKFVPTKSISANGDWQGIRLEGTAALCLSPGRAMVLQQQTKQSSSQLRLTDSSEPYSYALCLKALCSRKPTRPALGWRPRRLCGLSYTQRRTLQKRTAGTFSEDVMQAAELRPQPGAGALWAMPTQEGAGTTARSCFPP